MSVKKISFIVGLIILLFQIGCQKSEKPAVRKKADKIFFLSNREAPKREFDIFSMDLDGGNPKNLTKNLSGVRAFSKVAVSNDGGTIVFEIFNPPQRKLVAMNVGDSSIVEITELNHDKPEVCFCPADSFVVFVDIVDGKKQIFRVKLDGSDKTNLTSNNFNNFQPQISPDGSQICFTTERSKTKSIAIMNIDGSDQKVLTDDKGNDQHPHFSPEGGKIVFSSDRKGVSDIFMLEISTSKISDLFVNKSYDIEPQFSPDGKFVLFISNMRGLKYRDLILLNLKSGKIKNLTESLNHFNQNPEFLPDGKSVVFESIRFEDAEIYRVGIDGRNLINLTNHPKWDLAPVW